MLHFSTAGGGEVMMKIIEAYTNWKRPPIKPLSRMLQAFIQTP